mgnify:CR=1 FL=1
MTDLPRHFRAAESALWPPYASLTTTETPVVVATRDLRADRRPEEAQDHGQHQEEGHDPPGGAQANT